MDREQLAWAAGFFDGEGYIYIDGNQTHYGYAHLGVNQVELQPLERMKAAVGGLGSITGPRILPKRKPIYAWKVNGYEPTQAVAAMLWPWLSDFRKDQVAEILTWSRWYLSQRGSFTKGGTHCKRGHPYEGNRTKWGQCRACMRESDRLRHR